MRTAPPTSWRARSSPRRCVSAGPARTSSGCCAGRRSASRRRWESDGAVAPRVHLTVAFPTPDVERLGAFIDRVHRNRWSPGTDPSMWTVDRAALPPPPRGRALTQLRNPVKKPSLRTRALAPAVVLAVGALVATPALAQVSTDSAASPAAATATPSTDESPASESTAADESAPAAETPSEEAPEAPEAGSSEKASAGDESAEEAGRESASPAAATTPTDGATAASEK